MGECLVARSSLSEAECQDPITGGSRMARGEWAAYRYVTDEAAQRAGELGPQLISLAELDVREAENFYGAASVWHSDCWNPIGRDGELLMFLSVVYLSRLGRAEVQACASSLGGLVTVQELEHVIDFAAGLVSKGSAALDPQRLALLSVSDQGTIATTIAATGEDEEEEKELASEFLEHKWESVRSRPSCRGFLELADIVLRSPYFLMPPARDEGPACARLLLFIRSRLQEGHNASLLQEMELEIVECYKTGRVVLGQEDWEEYFARSMDDPFVPGWGLLKTSQLKELFSAGSLAGFLFTTKPPNNVISSHLLAVFDCVVHARLFLQRYSLPVYSHYNGVTYKRLGEDVEREREVTRSENGFMGRIPSYVERLLRGEAMFEIHDCLSQSGGKGLVYIYNVTVPSCSRLKVPTFLRDVRDAFRYVDGWNNELGSDFAATLWYESKLGFWLGIDKVEGETTVRPRSNPALMTHYQSMSKFIEFLAPGKVRRPLEVIEVIA